MLGRILGLLLGVQLGFLLGILLGMLLGLVEGIGVVASRRISCCCACCRSELNDENTCIDDDVALTGIPIQQRQIADQTIVRDRVIIDPDFVVITDAVAASDELK